MSVLAPGRNLVLTGMMGSGKTAVGRLLATRLGRPFVDTDEVVEAETRLTVAALFAHGERAFRAAEAEAVRRVSALRGQVIAVGGGAVVDPGNATALRATGDLVLLHAEPVTLAARIGAGADRPLLAGADDPVGRLEALQAARAAAYQRAVVATFDTTGLDAGQVADAILAWALRRPGLLTADERSGPR